MPELPEVETTLNGIKPFILKKKIKKIVVRHHGLRWPIPTTINKTLSGQIIQNVTRRGKYLLLTTSQGTILLHLGMSGSLRILTEPTPPQKHDHLDMIFAPQTILRFTDPRRFGSFLWTTDQPEQHPLLAHLGPEPLSAMATGQYLWQKAQGRKVPIKSFIMDSKIIVGVGNIYATEALFAAGISPKKPAGSVSLSQYNQLINAIQKTLKAAIKKGGTTLKDFVNSEGKQGYFSIHLKVYGRKGLPCLTCKTPLKEIRIGQRSTVYCSTCQP